MAVPCVPRLPYTQQICLRYRVGEARLRSVVVGFLAPALRPGGRQSTPQGPINHSLPGARCTLSAKRGYRLDLADGFSVEVVCFSASVLPLGSSGGPCPLSGLLLCPCSWGPGWCSILAEYSRGGTRGMH